MLFTDTVHEELHSATAWTDIDIKMLSLYEQLPEFAENSPIGSLVQALRPDVLKLLIATRTDDWAEAPCRIFRLMRIGIYPNVVVAHMSERRIFNSIS